MSETVTQPVLASDMQADFAALVNGSAILLRPTAGVLRLSDADRHDFLQRMTTNNIAILRPGQSAVTVLTSPTARILYVFTVIARSDDLILLPAPGQGQALARHLRSQIFFMDKVKVHDLSSPDPAVQDTAAQDRVTDSQSWSRLRVMGPQAAQALAALGAEVTSLAPDSVIIQDNFLVVAQPHYEVPGFEIVVTAADVTRVVDTLVTTGAAIVSDTAYDARRVEMGRPAAGAELTEDYSPLEAGLAWACAENKGCYTGQEIIARQITYDKVTKHLVGVQLQGAVAPGSDISVEGRSVGIVTSVAHSPTLNTPIALAIVKRPYNAPGTTIQIGDQDATVVLLPFES